MPTDETANSTAPSPEGQPPPRRANRLANETSPYLQQHAFNPVDWFPWGPEALELARSQNKPIFLSIGYSACHWCHVMEHESFENPAIAQRMNDWFINIKVDREERPDLDQIYMNAVVVMTGSGGWPMSVFLTPDLKPFFGGTYWPPVARFGRPGFAEILTAIHDAWTSRREALDEQAEELTRLVREAARPRFGTAAIDETLLKLAAQSLLQSADREHGGFGRAPKFPHPMDLRLALRLWQRFQDRELLDVAALTLRKMAAGGIYDQLGGGFARYSTDERWLVPHFEKMLYDNALLVPCYLELWQITRDPADALVVHETLDYVLREMTQPAGGFYSTQDADSEGVEGKFFVWSRDEIIAALGADDAAIFCQTFDVSQAGNWEEHNILNRPAPYSLVAQRLGLSLPELLTSLARSRQKLFELRAQRVAPGRDDKVLTSWNGLMIAAMAFAARVLHEPRYLSAGIAAGEFVWNQLRNEQGRLWHCYKDGQSRFPAYAEDYACLLDGFIELYQSSFDARWLERAIQLADVLVADFHDPAGQGFFFTAAHHETLIARNKQTEDNATPSANSMAATALLKLARLTGRTDYETLAVDTLSMLSGMLRRAPLAGGQALVALDFWLGPAYEFVLADGMVNDQNEAVLAAINERFLPRQVVARRSAGIHDEQLPAMLKSLLGGKTAPGNEPALFRCQHGACQLPVSGLADITRELTNLSGTAAE